MIELYVDIKERAVYKNAYDRAKLTSLDLRAADLPAFNVFFMLPRRDPRAPFAITRFASAALSLQLLDADRVTRATQNVWTELAPATTTPVITRQVVGTAAVGEYDRITFPSVPGSGNYALILSGGQAATSGQTSAVARVYPGVSLEAEIAAAFASIVGAPWTVSYVSPTIIDVSGKAVANPAHITEVNVSNLQYLFGYTALLDLTGAGPLGAADPLGDTPQVRLALSLTPSGGQLQNVMQLLINLHS